MVELRQIEFTIRDNHGRVLREPVFVENCAELPHALMQAMEDFMDAYELRPHLPLTIRIDPHPEKPTC